VPALAGYPFVNEINIYLIGEGITNRRLLGRKVGWDWNEEFEFLAGLKEKYGIENSNSPLCGREKFGEKLDCIVMSKFTNEVRTFFQEKSKDFS
jgi:hypothetical protein